MTAALNRPGFRVFVCGSAWHSLAYLCAREGPAAPQAAESTILIIAEPTEQPDVVELIDAIDRYAPHVTLWQYTLSETPNMRGVTAEDLSAWRTGATPAEPEPSAVLSKAVPTEPPAPVGPTLRLAGEGPIPPPVVPLEQHDPPSPHPDVKLPAKSLGDDVGHPVRVPQPLLTDEELHMLLAGDERKRT